ncbi:SpoIID/LytB domain-containing protein [candidate division KSB1 bacterium]|nr:SpoIID/LytB domain-containing protein [candidate division KSB1 bacterium]
MANNRPRVRIGMIQSADSISFRCSHPFQATDLGGQVLFAGQADKIHTFEILDAVPAKIDFAVRLAIAESRADAERIQRNLTEKSIATELWNPGIVLEIEETKVDNREFWIVTEPFSSRVMADAFTRAYELAGEAVVVNKIIESASGRVRIGDYAVPGGIRIEPQDEGHIFLQDVTVGIEFHWQHKRTQELPGVLEIGINNNGKLLAINELDIETYLISVNSSEMTAENPIELLKAQTVAARSTILATMGKHHYDSSFHLCSDDHCQCYHGIANISNASQKAADATCGETLFFNGRVCDARYAKICGGVMENYESVWDHRRVPYLVEGVDGKEKIELPVNSEEAAKALIDASPDVFCNTQKYRITSPLPYDSTELFRWTVTYTRAELQELLENKLEEDFGELVDLIPGERGASGRLINLDIIGSKKSIRIGKELAIRRALSKSHLYSACFYIERELEENGMVRAFHLHGAGWGHGVGLCQVGATVMAQLGYEYREILAHYYKRSELLKAYK